MVCSTDSRPSPSGATPDRAAPDTIDISYIAIANLRPPAIEAWRGPDRGSTQVRLSAPRIMTPQMGPESCLDDEASEDDMSTTRRCWRSKQRRKSRRGSGSAIPSASRRSTATSRANSKTAQLRAGSGLTVSSASTAGTTTAGSRRPDPALAPAGRRGRPRQRTGFPSHGCRSRSSLRASLGPRRHETALYPAS